MHEPPRRKAALLSSAGRAVCRPESEIETHLSSGHADFGRTAPMMDQERKKTCAETAVGKRNQPDSNAPNEQIAVYALRSCTALQNHSYLCACIIRRSDGKVVSLVCARRAYRRSAATPGRPATCSRAPTWRAGDGRPSQPSRKQATRNSSRRRAEQKYMYAEFGNARGSHP